MDAPPSAIAFPLCSFLCLTFAAFYNAGCKTSPHCSDGTSALGQ